MANKTYTYNVHWAWKEEGNRTVEGIEQVKATTVQRACSKAIKELNADGEGGYFEKDHEDYVKAADVLIIACQNITRGWTA
jgi:hypothetical protein